MAKRRPDRAISPFRLWGTYLSIALLCALLVALLAAFTKAGQIYDYQDTVDGVRLPKVDAIVCLAGGRGRIMAAGDLWYRYWEAVENSDSTVSRVPTLYFSGLGPQVNWGVLSKLLRKGVVDRIRPQDVIIERESSNTLANARWVALYAQQHHWRRILLLTSSYHMKRARLIFDYTLQGLEYPVQVETLSVYQEPFAPEEWKTGPNGIRVTLLEYIKWIYYKTLWRKAL